MDANQSKNDIVLNKDFKSLAPWYFQPKKHKITFRTCESIKDGVSELIKKHPEMSESEAINYLIAKGLGLKMNSHS